MTAKIALTIFLKIWPTSYNDPELLVTVSLLKWQNLATKFAVGKWQWFSQSCFIINRPKQCEVACLLVHSIVECLLNLRDALQSCPWVQTQLDPSIIKYLCNHLHVLLSHSCPHFRSHNMSYHILGPLCVQCPVYLGHTLQSCPWVPTPCIIKFLCLL